MEKRFWEQFNKYWLFIFKNSILYQLWSTHYWQLNAAALSIYGIVNPQNETQNNSILFEFFPFQFAQITEFWNILSEWTHSGSTASGW
jgi:hypothetical protein